jgi:hypothetical protein
MCGSVGCPDNTSHKKESSRGGRIDIPHSVKNIKPYHLDCLSASYTSCTTPEAPPPDDSPRHLQDLGHMVHHRQRSPSVLPLPEVEHGDDGGLPVLGRVPGDDGLHLFGVFFVELKGDLCLSNGIMGVMCCVESLRCRRRRKEVEIS